MRQKNLLALSGLIGCLGVVLAVASPAPTLWAQQPPGVPKGPVPEETMTERLARKTQVKEEKVTQLINLLGAEVKEELSHGRTVNLPALGTFRVVEVPEHADMKDGRPVTVAALNSVEFLPDAGLNGAANGPGAKPAAVVPDYKFNPFPNQSRDSGQRVPSTRQPNDRIRN